MKKRFEKIIKKYNCKLCEYENVNNFWYRYIIIDIDDENDLHLDEYDYEYHIDDDREQIFIHFEEWLKQQLS